ncbi:hypothetical protein, partial [Streptococcus pneumoniae]|uniref:hypothetical protein n=3 Tax=Streptococcus pneumoniae TaxID=1313 RepID=UPI00214D6ED2
GSCWCSCKKYINIYYNGETLPIYIFKQRRKNMFKNFCQNAFISLYFIVSALGGFSARLEFRSFSPYQSMKVALLLGVILILLQLPIMFAKLLEALKIKKGETHE